MNSLKPVSLSLFLLSLVSAVNMVFASDPDILSDFVTPTNTSVDGKFFTFTEPAVAISSFGSANAGTVSVPLAVFSTGNDDGILVKAFKTGFYTIQKIKSGSGKP